VLCHHHLLRPLCQVDILLKPLLDVLHQAKISFDTKTEALIHISDLAEGRVEKVEDVKYCQQVVAKKGTFKNVEMYAAAVAYHCEKMSRL